MKIEYFFVVVNCKSMSCCSNIPFINKCIMIIIIILILSILGCPGSDEGVLHDTCSFNITIVICIFAGISVLLSIGYRYWEYRQEERQFEPIYHSV